MSMNKALSIIVILIVLAGIGYGAYALSTPAEPASNPNTSADQGSLSGQVVSTSSADTDSSTSTGNAPAELTSVTVTYDGRSFTPATVHIQKGGTVHWVDTSSEMWVASDPHPVHTGYDGTSRSQHCAPGYAGAAPFDECAPGTDFSFTFDKTGSWGYHDHLNDGAHGTVVVE